MAEQEFALPVGHETPHPLQIGVPFLQRVDIPNYNITYSSGIDILLGQNEEDARIYASFDGEIRYDLNHPFGVLELKVKDPTILRINRINDLIEPSLKLLRYINIDGNALYFAFDTLIRNSYQQTFQNANPASWHPIMRGVYNNQRVKEYLDANGNTGVNNIIDSFIQGESRLMVNCGDWIGAALPFTPNTNTPNYPPQRVLFLAIEDYTAVPKNPKYYFWRLLKNAYDPVVVRRQMTLITPHNRIGDRFDHPFLQALDIDLAQDVQPLATIDLTLPGRTDVTNNVLLFPIGTLANWGGTNINGNDPSDFEWRITNNQNLDFEVRRRQGYPATNVQLCGEQIPNSDYNACVDYNDPYIPDSNFVSSAIPTRITNIWNGFEDDINDICSILQIPSELLVSIIGEESRGDERSVRFEPINEPIYLNRLESYLSQDLYNRYLDFVNPNGRSLLVIPSNEEELNANIQNPIPNSTPTQWNITWNEAMFVSAYVPGKVSPGLTHNILITAYANWRWLITKFPFEANEAQNLVDIFDVTSIPQGISEEQFRNIQNPNQQQISIFHNTYSNVFNWLLNGRQAILAGAVKIKKDFLTQGVKLDPILVWSAYNAGSITYQNTYWGVNFNNPARPNYPVRAGWYYNACQDILATNGIESRNRFWRNL